MIEFVLALAMMGIVICGALIFIWWVIREHLAAKKLRYLIRLKNMLPPEELRPQHARAHIHKGSGKPRWQINYKVKGKNGTFITEASNEGEAVRLFIQSGNGVGFENILEITKL